MTTRAQVSAWMVAKYRSRRAESGALKVAKQLRKQGVPLQVTLAVLGIRQQPTDAPFRPAGLVELFCSTRSKIAPQRGVAQSRPK